MFEPLAIANCTLKAEVSDDSSTRKISGTIGEKVARGMSAQNVSAPSAITQMMYQRARVGRSRSKSSQVYFFPNESRPRAAGAPAEIRDPRPGGGAHAARGSGDRAQTDRRRSRVGGRPPVRAQRGPYGAGADRARRRGAGPDCRPPIPDRREPRGVRPAAGRHDGAGERDARLPGA